MRDEEIVRKIAEHCELKLHAPERPSAWAKGVYRSRSVSIDVASFDAPFLAIMISIFNPLKARLSLSYYPNYPGPDFTKDGLAVRCGESVSGYLQGEKNHRDHLGQTLHDHPDLCAQIARSRMCFGLDVYPFNRWGELRLVPYAPYWNPFQVTIEDWLLLIDFGTDLADPLEEYLRQAA